MESSLEIDFEEKLYSFLKQNKYHTFTRRALVDRLKELVTDPQLRKYGKRNLQKILNKLRDDDKIRVNKHQNKMYYSFLDPEDPSGLRRQTFISLKKVDVEPYPIPTYQELIGGEQIQQKKKSSGMKVIMLVGLILSLITGIIGAYFGGVFGASGGGSTGEVALGMFIGFGIGFLLPAVLWIPALIQQLLKKW